MADNPLNAFPPPRPTVAVAPQNQNVNLRKGYGELGMADL